ncbi:hypothetical protein Tco_1007048 [Tanacetum coccineum]|uniref:Uncharacterized protein n=1 Tax=Tanacetum coccineum TaxID=301880 RepID=A0ABQ5FJH6_9ASTR
MVFPNKIGFIITNLDIIGVIKDEERFGKLFDDNAICLCLLLAVEGEHLWCHLYNEIKNLKQRHNDEHYYGLKKDRNYVPTYTLSGFLFAFQHVPRAPPIKEHHSLFETYLAKLKKARKRGKTGLSSKRGIEVLEDEEMLHYEHKKIIVKENRFRLDEANRLSHGKNILAKLAPAKRNKLGSSSEKINSKVEDISRVLHCMDTVWLSDDTERFLGQPGQVKCKFPWNDELLLCSAPIAKRLALFYANGERYTAPWSEVDQFHILSGKVTFYDTGYTYDYDYRDWYVWVRQCLKVTCNTLKSEYAAEC